MEFTGNIVLVGFMGTGKTTIGKLCSRQLGLSFVDTDSYIEQMTNQSIRELFQVSEDYFRVIETKILKKVLTTDFQVVSTGGGIVIRPENRNLLTGSTNVVIWLTARPDIIYQRVQGGLDRPLLQSANPMAQIRRLLKEREQLYRSVADYSIDTSEKTTAQVVAAVLKTVP